MSERALNTLMIRARDVYKFAIARCAPSSAIQQRMGEQVWGDPSARKLTNYEFGKLRGWTECMDYRILCELTALAYEIDGRWVPASALSTEQMEPLFRTDYRAGVFWVDARGCILTERPYSPPQLRSEVEAEQKKLSERQKWLKQIKPFQRQLLDKVLPDRWSDISLVVSRDGYTLIYFTSPEGVPYQASVNEAWKPGHNTVGYIALEGWDDPVGESDEPGSSAPEVADGA